MITFESLIQIIDDRLNELLPETNCSILTNAGRYALFAPCKRLRPLLTLTSALALNGKIEKALDPACSIELIHTYSLIHDDLPCMDDDDIRRGKPSLHKVYPEGQALLTGNFLLTYSLEIIAKCKDLNLKQKIDLIALLTKRSGQEGMIGGQSEDLAIGEGKNKISFQILRQLHRKKTASLISAAMEAAGIISKVPQKKRRLLAELGFYPGKAFQALDDLSDQREKKEKLKNIAVYLSSSQLEAYIEKLKEKTQACLKQIEPKYQLLSELVDQILNQK